MKTHATVYRAWFGGAFQYAESGAATLGEPGAWIPAAEFDALAAARDESSIVIAARGMIELVDRYGYLAKVERCVLDMREALAEYETKRGAPIIAERARLAAERDALLAALSDLTAQCQKWAPTIDRSRAVEALRLARGA